MRVGNERKSKEVRRKIEKRSKTIEISDFFQIIHFQAFTSHYNQKSLALCTHVESLLVELKRGREYLTQREDERVVDREEARFQSSSEEAHGEGG